VFAQRLQVMMERLSLPFQAFKLARTGMGFDRVRG
jgi:hypothetical protein